MSCDYCARSGEVTAATGGLGRTFSRARWSAGRTDVQAWFEERRREAGASRPLVQVAVPSPPPTVETPGKPRIGLSPSAAAKLPYGRALNGLLRYGLREEGDLPTFIRDAGDRLTCVDGAAGALARCDEVVCYSYPVRGRTAMALVYRNAGYTYRIAVDDRDRPHEVYYSRQRYRTRAGYGLDPAAAAAAMTKVRQRRSDNVLFYCVRCGAASQCDWGPESLCDTCKNAGHSLKNLSWE